MSWGEQELAALGFAQAEIERLDQKADLMRRGEFGPEERAADASWRARNKKMLDKAQGY